MPEASRDTAITRTSVIHPALGGGHGGRNGPEALEEAVSLARAIDLEVRDARVLPVKRPRAGTFLGKGQVEDLRFQVVSASIDLVFVDTALSPVQQRNLEQQLQTKVIDRTGLILDIFGARAATREGVLQVEMAALTYQRSRLVRSWTHLERQRGGLGFVGGPGESQLEIDRRLIGQRIARLRRELDGVVAMRGQHRNARRKVPWPTVALVGYTNAGKSTLFNRLTGAAVYADDRLFATLDPTMRALDLGHGMRAILSDTVGFVSDLPETLVAAFRATLEEVTEASLIVHVRNAHHPEHELQAADVMAVLENLGIDELDASGRMVTAYNKRDMLDDDSVSRLHAIVERQGDAAVISARTGEGLDDLVDLIARRLAGRQRLVELSVPVRDGAAIGFLYRHADVVERSDGDHDIRLKVRIRASDLGRFRKRFPHPVPSCRQ